MDEASESILVAAAAAAEIETPPVWPFSSSGTLPLTLLPVMADEEEACLSRLVGSPTLPLRTREEDNDDACGGGGGSCARLLSLLLLLPLAAVAVAVLALPSLAAFNFARTRAASASRSEAANLAAIRAMLSGDCCGGGKTPTLRGLGRREDVLGGDSCSAGGSATVTGCCC